MSRTPDAPPDPQPAKKAGDLTVNKIIAGAGAAATAAVLGSYLGAFGTVAGAAIGSVASTVVTSVYQRSLDRTRATVSTRIRRRRGPDGGAPDPGTADPDTEVLHPVPGPGADDDTELLRPVPDPRARRRWWPYAVLAAVVFVIGLLVVTGVEFLKGSTITGNQPGTSVGQVVAPPADDGDQQDEDSSDGDGDGEDDGNEDEDNDGEDSTRTSDPDDQDSDNTRQRDPADDGTGTQSPQRTGSPLVPDLGGN